MAVMTAIPETEPPPLQVGLLSEIFDRAIT
jgi:hypothetical protein